VVVGTMKSSMEALLKLAPATALLNAPPYLGWRGGSCGDGLKELDPASRCEKAPEATPKCTLLRWDVGRAPEMRCAFRAMLNRGLPRMRIMEMGVPMRGLLEISLERVTFRVPTS
jgi:hypothetical protein